MPSSLLHCCVCEAGEAEEDVMDLPILIKIGHNERAFGDHIADYLAIQGIAGPLGVAQQDLFQAPGDGHDVDLNVRCPVTANPSRYEREVAGPRFDQDPFLAEFPKCMRTDKVAQLLTDRLPKPIVKFLFR